VGIHVPPTLSTTNMYLRVLHSTRALVPGTYIVDLTHNALLQYTGRGYDKIDPARADTLVKSLPFGPRVRLQAELRRHAAAFEIGPQRINLSEFDSAFELQSAEGLISAEKWESFPILHIRDAFFVFLIDFLGDYSKYIIPPSGDLTADTYRTFQEEFAIQQYLDMADRASRPTMELLLETQMFSALLQRRAEGRQRSLVFFETAGMCMSPFSCLFPLFCVRVCFMVLCEFLDKFNPCFYVMFCFKYVTFIQERCCES
jgi:hypothetical protein